MNRDFAEMLVALSAAGADYLVVGAYAMAAHDRPRATGDIDIWIRPSAENARKVWTALVEFGAPLHDLTPDDLSTPGLTFQMGLPPSRIDLLTDIDGVEFEDAWGRRLTVDDSELTYFVIGRSDLIRNKRATGRAKDLVDADALEQ